MQFTPNHSIWLVALALVYATSAQAGRPLQTEDAGVLEPRGCEIEGAMLRTSTKGEHSTEQGLGAACGVGWNSQLGLGLTNTRERGLATRSAQVGGKVGLWRGASDEAAAVTLAWAWGLGLDRERGSDWKHSASEVGLVASVPVGSHKVHVDVGHVRQLQSRLVFTTWSLALEMAEHEIGGLRWAPMVELFGDDRAPPWWNLALRANVMPERLFFDLSYGRQTHGDKPALLTAGFKLVF